SPFRSARGRLGLARRLPGDSAADARLPRLATARRRPGPRPRTAPPAGDPPGTRNPGHGDASGWRDAVSRSTAHRARLAMDAYTAHGEGRRRLARRTRNGGRPRYPGKRLQPRLLRVPVLVGPGHTGDRGARPLS